MISDAFMALIVTMVLAAMSVWVTGRWLSRRDRETKDDTEMIQDAVDFVGKHRGIVYLAPGEFKISKCIWVKMPWYVRLWRWLKR